jgi:hypothetical protein
VFRVARDPKVRPELPYLPKVAAAGRSDGKISCYSRELRRQNL